jgi:hypothetical protein
MVKHKTQTASSLKGWQQIAAFLGEPVSVVKRWSKTGMPVSRQGRFVTASPDALNLWLGRESGGKPVHAVAPETDLLGELKRGLSFVRKQRKPNSRRK